MKKSENQGQDSGGSGNPTILGDFMGALQRLFKICVYYPLGHRILDQAIDRFLVILFSLADKKNTVRIEEDGKSLVIQGVHLGSNHAFAGEFWQLMTALSITAIEIERKISEEDLHQFVTKMINLRSQSSRTNRFSSIEITGFPPSVHITRREYLTREDASKNGNTDSATENLDTFFKALTGFGLTSEQIEKCRVLLASLPEHMKKMKFKAREMPSVNWDDIALLLARAVTGKQQEGKSSFRGDLDILAAILRNLEQGAEDSSSREAINLLVSILRKPVPKQDQSEKEDAPKKKSSDEGMGTVEVGVLQEYVDRNQLASSSLKKIQDIPTGQETLSILLQVMQKPQTLSVQNRMMEFYYDVFETPPNDKTWQILCRGLLAVVQADDPENLAVVIPMIIEVLRRSKHVDPLDLFLNTFNLCSGQEESVLWPFAVNELLISGCRTGSDSFRRLSDRLARLSLREMVLELPVLQKLEVFQKGRITAVIFPEIGPASYPLCAFLLKTQIAPKVEAQILAGLKTETADQMLKAVAPLLDLSIPEHKAFLDRYLRQWKQRGAGEELKVQAGDIIVRGLNELPTEMREQPWVAETIGATADFRGEGVRGLLERIISEKRLLLMPGWPSDCRKAAEEAKAKLRSRSAARWR